MPASNPQATRLLQELNTPNIPMPETLASLAACFRAIPKGTEGRVHAQIALLRKKQGTFPPEVTKVIENYRGEKTFNPDTRKRFFEKIATAALPYFKNTTT